MLGTYASTSSGFTDFVLVSLTTELYPNGQQHYFLEGDPPFRSLQELSYAYIPQQLYSDVESRCFPRFRHLNKDRVYLNEGQNKRAK